MSKSELVSSQHLARKAIVYIRQSTPQQVLTNQESLELQYALKQRATELGWSEESVEIIDDDLGLTGTSAEHREGFKNLVAQVTLEQVGVIIAYDVTRLSRNCSDWYPLLDICGYKGCLIADRDGTYDPSSTNGRLLLGLKGQLAEVELSTIRARLSAGILNKAQRGELIRKLPVGFILNEHKEVQKDPNGEIQQRIALIFDSFLRLKSASRVLRYLNENQLGIPRFDRYAELTWQEPTISRIVSFLKNPAYAGTYAYGRSKQTRYGPAPRDFSMKTLPMDQWQIVIHNKYPAYISWKLFERIQAMLKDNYAEYDRNKTRGIPRGGAALLHGIVYCGECGHKMLVQYKKLNRYICNHHRQQNGTAVCQFIPADPIDQTVVTAFFEALSPIELNSYEQALAQHRKAEDKVDQAFRQKLERIRYQAKLAERQFNQSDPDNRLVTAELERRWEFALRDLKDAEEEYKKRQTVVPLPIIPAQLRTAFSDLGKKLPDIWDSEFLSREKKKAFLRCLIDKVVVHRAARDCLELRIIWKGNEISEFQIPINVNSFAELSTAKEMEQTIIKMANENYSDDKIAAELTKQGHRSPLRNYVLASTVQNIRLKHGILRKASQSHKLVVPGSLTASQIAKTIGVSRHWIYDRINNGTINIEKDLETGSYLFPDTANTIDLFNQLKNRNLNKLYFSGGHQDA